MRKVLITAIVILSLILAALLGFIWYTSTHVFIDGSPYALYADSLDLREKEVTESHYLAVQANLPDCEIIWNVPFQGGVQSSDAVQLSISTLAEEDIRLLAAYFPNLTQIDASACRDYTKLAQLAQVLPDCDVNYQVELGAMSADPEAQMLTLEAGSYDFDTMLANLIHMPNLRELYFPKAELTPEQQAALEEAYPEISISTTVVILGKEYDSSTTVLDLSSMTSGDVDEVGARLALLPNVSEVQLMSSSSATHLTLEDVQKLNLAAPEVAFHYSFDFYGIAVSTMDQEVILKNIKVENDHFAQDLRMLLDVMENCDRVVLEARGQYDKLWQKISDEELAKIREECRGKTNMVWRVYFGENGSTLTDAEVLRAVYGLTDDNSKDLIYCENVRYLDVGHNEFLDYMEFLSGMKDLEVAILSGAPLKDLSPIAACKNLKFLEIANCIYLPDFNALKECTQLEMLNISFTRVEDISMLMDLNLTHLTTVKTPNVVREAGVAQPSEALLAFMEAHPDCWTVFEGDQPYGVGWRYAENEQDFLDWYAKMVKAFKYPNPYNNIGWYLPDDFE
ncbi:MAG: leucine-rich repeat domain-containing protein [Oscillospiraceae bacterium]|nr:leucine-rich repeat domain-containing protein [Oscillospiraceae bacterium]